MNRVHLCIYVLCASMCYGYDSNILKFMKCTIGPIGPWMFDDVALQLHVFSNMVRGWRMAMVQNNPYNILKLEGCRNKTHETNTFEYISIHFNTCHIMFRIPDWFYWFTTKNHPSHHGTMAGFRQPGRRLFRRRGRRKSRRFDRDFDFHHLGYGKFKIMGETDLIKHQTSWILMNSDEFWWILMNSDEFWWIWWIHCYLSHTQMVDKSLANQIFVKGKQWFGNTHC